MNEPVLLDGERIGTVPGPGFIIHQADVHARARGRASVSGFVALRLRGHALSEVRF
jgi:hypothetical protein